MSKQLLFTLGLSMLLSTAATAQDHINPEDRTVDMDSPTFVPMVHIGKAKVGADSIQYVRTSNVYVFPPLEFKNKAQETAYYRLVYNIKKVLPVAKECHQIILETARILRLSQPRKNVTNT